MRIGDSVAGIRRKLNDSFGKVPYVGGALTHDINPGGALRNTLTGLVVGAALVNSGCMTTAVGVAGYYVGKDHGSRNAVAQDVEVDNVTELTFRKWKDFNGDGKTQIDEYLDKVNGRVNLDKTGVTIILMTPYWNPSPKKFSLLDSNYNELTTFSSPIVTSAKDPNILRTEISCYGDVSSNYFMDIFKNLEAGDYILRVSISGENFMEKFSVERNPGVNLESVSQ